eukprot:comp52870_c0_seq1/m.47712 comp52870_c0_seq1/g.47712  ORF comp52870_c0_seq1/g.47712 comp52870_c0_seq1/m.47712 type:complete len:305 (-) comp52870_c0_seq1:982-1896(-)
MGDLEEQIYALLKSSQEGVKQTELGIQLPDTTQQERMTALQALVDKGKVQLRMEKNGSLVFHATTAPDPIQGLSKEERLVYQFIDEAGNMGIWTRDLRYKANLQQTQMNKILKNLENRQIVKAVKSVVASKKKLYMKFELEPDRSLTGGAWYSESEFDEDFVQVLLETCTSFIRARAMEAQARHTTDRWRNSYVTAREVHTHISRSGISNVSLQEEDVECLLNTLVYDGKVELATSGTTITPTRDSTGAPIPLGTSLYRATDATPPSNGFTKTPCGVCPVFELCYDGNPISPTTCVYMKEWLEY